MNLNIQQYEINQSKNAFKKKHKRALMNCGKSQMAFFISKWTPGREK